MSGFPLEAITEIGFCVQGEGGMETTFQESSWGKQSTGTRRNSEVGSRLFNQISKSGRSLPVCGLFSAGLGQLIPSYTSHHLLRHQVLHLFLLALVCSPLPHPAQHSHLPNPFLLWGSQPISSSSHLSILCPSQALALGADLAWSRLSSI